MISNKKPSIEYSGDDKNYSLKFSNCTLEISRGNISLIDPPNIDIENEGQLRAQGVLRGTNGLDRLLFNIGGQNFQDLIFIACSIKFNREEIPFNGASLCFERCKFDGPFIYKNRTFSIENPEEGDLCFYDTWKVSIKNLKLTVLNIAVDSGENNTMGMYVPSDDHTVTLSGQCASFTTARGEVKIDFNDDFFGEVVSLSNSIFMKGFVGKKNSLIKRVHDNLELHAVSNLSELHFNNITVSLLVENVDLSKTKIYFKNNAALNFDGLRSIASIWEPEMINYRGFSPNMSVSDVNFQEINPLPAQEFFCEMKAHFGKRGNSILSADFYSSEMKAHLAYLTKKNKSSGDRLALLLSLISSNFGQDWIRALGIYLVLGLFTAYTFWFWGKPTCDFEFSRLLANTYSPLTIDFDHVSEKLDISSWFAFLWIAWKVSAGYLIYQIIISTRRFTKKW